MNRSVCLRECGENRQSIHKVSLENGTSGGRDRSASRKDKNGSPTESIVCNINTGSHGKLGDGMLIGDRVDQEILGRVGAAAPSHLDSLLFQEDNRLT